MKHVAFLTLKDPIGFVIYDSLCIPHFLKKSIEVSEIPWTQHINWSIFDIVIIRSPWDYQQNWYHFMEVLKNIQSHTLLANPLEVVLWNYKKTYLQELINHSFQIVDTIFLEHTLSSQEFENIQQQFTTQQLVIKPQISANADDTFILKNFDDYKLKTPIFQNKPYMIQPYLKNIENDGEVSLFYFNGKYSHAVIKKPKLGDFRVQEEHGGLISAFEPSTTLINFANSISSFLNQKFGTLLYARFDFVHYQDNWKIMELELIEPSLYFPYHENACTNFVDAVEEWYHQRK